MITQEMEQTREAWNNIATGYDEFVAPTEVWLASEALRRARLVPGERFLDVAAGCGGLNTAIVIRCRRTWSPPAPEMFPSTGATASRFAARFRLAHRHRSSRCCGHPVESCLWLSTTSTRQTTTERGKQVTNRVVVVLVRKMN